MLKIEDLKDLLHEANLGLSRLQIYSVLSEATVDDNGMVPSGGSGVRRALGVIVGNSWRVSQRIWVLRIGLSSVFGWWSRFSRAFPF